MAALPVSNTARFYLDYSDGINQHTLVCRYNSPVSTPRGAGDAVHDLLVNIADAFTTITVLGARNSPKNSTLSFPVEWNGLPAYGGGAMIGRNAPRQFLLLGRSPGGRRMRLFLFGYEGDTPDNFRMARSAGNVVDDALISIETWQGDGYWLAIDGQVPAMYAYADFNYNNHFEKIARG